jgi:hypothetical protein
MILSLPVLLKYLIFKKLQLWPKIRIRKGGLNKSESGLDLKLKINQTINTYNYVPRQ